jgi:hypothetical protein
VATVWISSSLRELTSGRQTVTGPGASVCQVIERLDPLYPGLRDRFCAAQSLSAGLSVAEYKQVV